MNTSVEFRKISKKRLAHQSIIEQNMRKNVPKFVYFTTSIGTDSVGFRNISKITTIVHQSITEQNIPKFVYFTTSIGTDRCVGSKDEERLHAKLFGDDYNPAVRPVNEENTTVAVDITMNIHQIVDVVSVFSPPQCALQVVRGIISLKSFIRFKN